MVGSIRTCVASSASVALPFSRLRASLPGRYSSGRLKSDKRSLLRCQGTVSPWGRLGYSQSVLIHVSNCLMSLCSKYIEPAGLMVIRCSDEQMFMTLDGRSSPRRAVATASYT